MKSIKSLIYLFICAFLIFFNFNFGIAIVDGHSMDPTLHDNQICIMKKNCAINDGDIVVVDTSDYSNIPANSIVKRYIADLSTSDEVYLLGDNSKNSLDSRKLGLLNRSDIIGKIIYTSP